MAVAIQNPFGWSTPSGVHAPYSNCHNDEGFSPRRDLLFVGSGTRFALKQIPRRPKDLLVVTTTKSLLRR
jgi:hypothetical protein